MELRDIPPRMENDMEKNMEPQMESGELIRRRPTNSLAPNSLYDFGKGHLKKISNLISILRSLQSELRRHKLDCC